MLKNKFIYIVVLVMLFVLISTGCSNKTDRQLNQMYDQANVLLEEGNLESAIDVFNDMLVIQENSLIRSKLEESLVLQEDAIAEQEAVVTTKLLFAELNRIHEGINSIYNSADIMDLIEPIEKVIESFEQIDTSKGTEISQFVKSVKDHPEFLLFKNDYLSGKTILTAYDDSILISSKKSRVNIIVSDLLELKMPSKYDS